MQELKLPKRANRGDPENSAHPPSLDETLRYLVVLLRTDCDVRGGSSTDSTLQFSINEMGMERRRFQRLYQHPHWRLARQVAAAHHESRTREKTFGHYVFKHLSESARETWKELQFWAEHDGGHIQIERIMKKSARKLKQELFVHALVSTHYDVSRSLFMTGLAKTTLEDWLRTDPSFAELFDEVQWHKKNFFEKAMLDLVADRNPLATIWVNKTVNADRGYSEKIRVEHSIAADQGFTFEDLELDSDTRRKVLEAIRKRQAVKAGEGNGQKQLAAPVVDVEAVEEE